MTEPVEESPAVEDDGVDDTADEVTEDESGAADESELPTGGPDDDGEDWSDCGGDNDDPGTAQPDDPHGVN